jgi:hypothetical protein
MLRGAVTHVKAGAGAVLRVARAMVVARLRRVTPGARLAVLSRQTTGPGKNSTNQHTHSCDDTPDTVAQRQEPGGELGPTLHWQIPVELQVAFPPQSTAAEHPSQGQTAETPKHREKRG